MWAIVWCHIKACRRDLAARRLGDLQAGRGRAGQSWVSNEHREWRLR